MNGFKPVVGIEFDNKYINAKNKFFEFSKALNELTPIQKGQLAKEIISSAEMAASIKQFMNYIRNGGQI